MHFRLLILRAYVETFLEDSQISGHFIAVFNGDMVSDCLDGFKFDLVEILS